MVTQMSPFALLRAFRSQTGLPPHAYVNQQRVRLARSLLDSGVPPAEVAAQTGFADQAHLTRHFKRVVGVPPGAYQRERRAALRRRPHWIADRQNGHVTDLAITLHDSDDREARARPA